MNFVTIISATMYLIGLLKYKNICGKYVGTFLNYLQDKYFTN